MHFMQIIRILLLLCLFKPYLHYTMTSATPRPCPYCQQTFSPKRRNQRYCSSQCRIDANNDQARQAYKAYRQQAPQASSAQQHLRELKAWLSQQVLVVTGIEEVDPKTIRWNDKLYRRQHIASDTVRNLKISLLAGGGVHLTALDQVIYRRPSDTLNREAWSYERERKQK